MGPGVRPSVPPPVGLSRPPGAPAAALDPNNPLAAVAKPFAQSRVPASPAQPQATRIEVDEVAVKQASSGGFKRGVTLGFVMAVLFGGVGYAGGNAVSASDARNKGVHDAHDLAQDLTKTQASLLDLQKKLEGGATTLVGQRKFPSDLSGTLSGMNIDFGGDKLMGRRFSGVPAETTRQLFDFITRVQALNDKKDLVVSLLNRLQKPITEEFARTTMPVSQIIIVDKDTPSAGALIASLAAPIPDANAVPDSITFINPKGGGNVKLPKLKDLKIPTDGAAIALSPGSFDKVCPAATHGQIAQLASTMRSVIDDIQGQKGAEGGDAVTETKPGLAEIAGKLSDQLTKVN
jgi:hypothetical protein